MPEANGAKRSERKERKPRLPSLTPAARRKKITELLQQGAKMVRARGGDVNVATAMVLEENAAMLGEAYATASEQSAWLARTLDSMLTGGVWGQLLIANAVVLVQIALIRGWLDPSALPSPFNMIFAPPPSAEQQAEAQRRAHPPKTDARPTAASPSRAPTPPPAPPPRPEGPPAAPGDRDYVDPSAPSPSIPVGDDPDADVPNVAQRVPPQGTRNVQPHG